MAKKTNWLLWGGLGLAAWWYFRKDEEKKVAEAAAAEAAVMTTQPEQEGQGEYIAVGRW